MSNTDPQIEIHYHTDPLCCWSWAMEPAWRKLRYLYGGQVGHTYHMGGMLPDWNSYNDPVNSIGRPAQMGPLWVEAAALSGMPIRAELWVKSPPASSYPACMAVKTAARQSAEAGETLLRRLREAVMLEGKDIAQTEVLLEAAQGLRGKHPDFDMGRFKEDLLQKKAIEDFRKDLDLTRQQHITRFPTLIIRKGDRGKVLTGYRPFEALEAVLTELQPDLRPERALDRDDYAAYWGDCTERELEETTEKVNDRAHAYSMDQA